MKTKVWGTWVCACALGSMAGLALAQNPPDIGKMEYQTSCASCHGVSGKGDGPMASQLHKKPDDLTTVAKANGGVFPYKRLEDFIDGRAYVNIGSHGPREMPVWGNIYRMEDNKPQDWHARNRIAALLDYLNRIQEK
jgi:mono/diheme cytochrome c family protein